MNPGTPRLAPRTCIESGFTLVEMVVVVVILAVIAALVYPRLAPSGDAELRTSARSLAASIRYLEDRAITTKTAYRMRLNLNDTTIEVFEVLSDGEEQPAADVFLGRNLLADGIAIADVTTSRLGKVAAGEVSLDFGPLGLGEFIVIHLTTGKERYYTVQAYPRGGRVKVFDNYSGGTL